MKKIRPIMVCGKCNNAIATKFVAINRETLEFACPYCTWITFFEKLQQSYVINDYVDHFSYVIANGDKH